MRLLNFDIHCYRGESFTLDMSIVNDDRSPYVLSNADDWEIHFVISSCRYPQDDDIVTVYKLDLSQMPKFEVTQSLKIDTTDIWPPVEHSTLNDEGYDDYSTYYVQGSDGTKHYYMYVSGTYVEYDFPIILHFKSTDTANWIEQRYFYSIKLISKNNENCTILLEPHNLYVHSDRTEV